MESVRWASAGAVPFPQSVWIFKVESGLRGAIEVCKICRREPCSDVPKELDSRDRHFVWTRASSVLKSLSLQLLLNVFSSLSVFSFKNT